ARAGALAGADGGADTRRRRRGRGNRAVHRRDPRVEQAGQPARGRRSAGRCDGGFRCPVLDVPTGLELEHGIVGEPAVRAAATLTLALPKEALRAGAARPLVGDLYLADISIPAIVYD